MVLLKRVYHYVTWPQVRLTHPHFHFTVYVLCAIHLMLAFSSIVATHTTPLWFYCGGTIGIVSLGVSHLLIAVIVIIGAYKRYALVRFGMLASVTVYLLTLCLFLAAVIRSRLLPDVIDLSFETTIFTAGMAMISVSAYWARSWPYPSRS